MGIFTRVRDIISSNLNAMLDKAEDPEKLVRLMIREMEDTLVEIKASCAGAMASRKRLHREVDGIQDREQQWGDKAQLAVDKGREDLAREALLEKRRFRDRVASIEQDMAQLESLVEQYQSEISQLEDKLGAAREKKRLLVQRHKQAHNRLRSQKGIRKFDTADAMARFDHFQERIDRVDADADLTNYGRKPTLEEEFRDLASDEELEKELSELKRKED